MTTVLKNNVWGRGGWILLLMSFVSKAQVPVEKRQFMYQINVFHKGQVNPTVCTGFKPEGYSGIISALHGFTASDITDIVAIPEVSDKNKSTIKFPNIEIVGVDVRRDLVLLKCKGLAKKGGFVITADKVNNFEELYVYGYPQTRQLQGERHSTQDPGETILESMLKGTPTANIINLRGSPHKETTVIRLPSKAIQPGHSGGPVINKQGKVVGVADGGFIVGNGREVATMAIKSKATLPDETYKDFPDRFRKIFSDINKHPAIFLTSATDTTRSNQIINPFNFPKAQPYFTFGVTLSRPFWFIKDGIQADLDFRHMNGRFDGYIEWTPKHSAFAIGAYLSSRYLQYSILKAFDLNIPLQAERTIKQDNLADAFGVQTSYIFSRGIVHNAYVGGGFWPVLGSGDLARSRFNYRGFLGYRLYSDRRRKIGLELRAMYIGQNILEYRWRPTLGIARPVKVIQPLTQWYLCGGLTYSFYRHE